MTAGRMLRRELVETARALSQQGLNGSTSGNVSVRRGGDMLITPSGIPCDAMKSGMIVRMPLESDGSWKGLRAPSSEWRFHRDILRARPDAGAVIHTHATYCTVFAMLREPIPATHYMIAAFGGPQIRCTDYAPFGTQALSDLAVQGLTGRHAVLLGSHGMIVIGGDLQQALWRACELETLARQTYLARLMGKPVILEEDEIMRTVDRFRDYGPRATRPPA